ncbi:MAG: 4Fe-4S dicluster domain-containing protein [Anaerolineales bacterium]
MMTQNLIMTHGDPLGTIQNFLKEVWIKADLDGFVAARNGNDYETWRSLVVEHPDQLEDINPFRPLMRFNIARYLPDLTREREGNRYGILLRPCEMRAYKAMREKSALTIENGITVCFDCLGTFPKQEFEWRAQRKGSAHDLSKETLQFARQGGISAYRFRSACQMCASPDAQGADVNIGVIGLPVRKYLLVETRDQAVSSRIRADLITDGSMDSGLLKQRGRVLSRLTQRNRQVSERLMSSLADLIPSDLEEFLTHLETCGDCQECMENCPICVMKFPRRDESGRYLAEDVSDWLLSCAGCGMCEQACPRKMPLSAIFRQLRTQMENQAYAL